MLEPDPLPCHRVVQPSEEELERCGRRLVDVMLLAEALPVRHTPDLRYPRLPDLRRRLRGAELADVASRSKGPH